MSSFLFLLGTNFVACHCRVVEPEVIWSILQSRELGYRRSQGFRGAACAGTQAPDPPPGNFLTHRRPFLTALDPHQPNIQPAPPPPRCPPPPQPCTLPSLGFQKPMKSFPTPLAAQDAQKPKEKILTRPSLVMGFSVGPAVLPLRSGILETRARIRAEGVRAHLSEGDLPQGWTGAFHRRD